MYTQCPECSVAFRVSADVLKMAAGQVRCGGCGVAFNALEHLSETKPETPPLKEQPADPGLPELQPDEAGELEADAPPPSISAEQNEALLRTLDELAGEDVRIEDTGVEWRVIDDEPEPEPEPTEQEPNEPSQSQVIDEMLFDDNTVLPDDFDEVVEAPSQPRVEEAPSAPPEPEIPQFDLDLSEPGEWDDLLGDLDDRPEAAPVAEDVDDAEDSADIEDIEDQDAAEPEQADTPLDVDTQFEIQAEAMGIDLSGIHESLDKQEPAEQEEEPDLEPVDKADTSIEEDLMAAAFEVEAAARKLEETGTEESLDIEDDASEEALDLEELASEEAPDAEEPAAEEALDLEELAAEEALDLEELAAEEALDLEELAADEALDLEELATDEALDLEELSDEEALDLEILAAKEDPTFEDSSEEEEEPERQEKDEVEEDDGELEVDLQVEEESEIEDDVDDIARGFDDNVERDIETLSMSLDDDEDDVATRDEHHVIPEMSEEEKTINMMIDQELFNVAVEDEDGFASTIVQLQPDGEITEEADADDASDKPKKKKDKKKKKKDKDKAAKDSARPMPDMAVETIVMEGDFIRGDVQLEDLAKEDERAAASSSTESPFPIFRVKVDFARSREMTSAPPGMGMWIGIIALVLLLGVQLIHQSREALATVPAFNSAIGPIYRLLGRPLTPEWNIGGWRFEATKGDTDETGELLTIYSRVGNNSEEPLPYPLVHLSLTDRFEDIIGSAVMEPAEYLAENADPRKPVPPGSSFNAVISIESPSPEATGFKLNVCYRLASGQLRCADHDFK